MSEIAPKQNIVFQWISWQFFDVPTKILKAWKNFLKFNINYFSIPRLLRTLFSPWHQYQWSLGRGFDLGRYLEVFVSNIISRILGAILRISLIIIGLWIETVIFIFGLIVFLGWLILPILLSFGLYYGLQILFWFN